MRVQSVQNLGAERSAFGRMVQAIEKLSGFGMRQQKTCAARVGDAHAEPDVMQSGCEDDHDLGIGTRQVVPVDDARAMARFEENAQKTQAGVGDDSGVCFAVIAQPATLPGVHVRAAPKLP